RGNGAWLQKAQVGAAAPASIMYAADPKANPNGADTAPPIATAMTLNIPSGTPMGTYTGTLRFFNDLNVFFRIDPNQPRGHRHSTQYPQPGDGFLNRVGQVGPTFAE